ncbi:MAG: Smr/MutS family protein [Pseudomonadota bacterium]
MTSEKPPKRSAKLSTKDKSPPVKAPKLAKPLGHGTVADMDKRKADRFRRGQLSIEGRLDLHGYTQERAHGILTRFLAESQNRGLRCVLVITGKGRKDDPFGAGTGVLRQAVPQWLNQAPNRQRILSFSYAQPKHGGEGAIYVLLKRLRNKS